MKLVGIGDLFIPCSYIEKGFQNFAHIGVKIETVEWQLEDFDRLQEVNLKVEKNGSDVFETPDYLIEKVRNAEIIITHFCPITRNLIDSCPRLKVIGVLRSGYENVNVLYAQQKGILVFNTPGRNAEAVSDFTIGLMIAECRNIAKGHHGLKKGEWIRTYPNFESIPDLPGRTVGLIGLGEIGLKVAKKLSGFEMQILGYDPFCDQQTAKEHGIRLTELDELLKSSDFVSIHARLTEKNYKMIGARELSLMKPTAYLINTARAGLLDENALCEALKSGRIAGAAIDVFEKEPPGKGHSLVTLENITITPHMAGGSKDAFLNSPKRLALEMISLFKDKCDIKFLLNPDSLVKWRATNLK